jgi:hypothetical protein
MKMSRRALVVTTVILAAVLPVAAIAATGTGTGTAGKNKLTLKVGLNPARAGTKAKPRATALNYTQILAAKDGSRIKTFLHTLTIHLPKGMTFNIHAVAQCKESIIDSKTKGPSKCPKASIVGTGSATADARPTLPKLVKATVTAYNGVLDTTPAGKAQKPVPAILVVAIVKSLKFTASFPAEIRGTKLVLDQGAPPADGSSGLFIIHDLTLHLKKITGAKGPYIRTPTTCPKGGWKFSQTDAFSGGVPAVTAKTSLPCKKA